MKIEVKVIDFDKELELIRNDVNFDDEDEQNYFEELESFVNDNDIINVMNYQGVSYRNYTMLMSSNLNYIVYSTDEEELLVL